MRSRQRDGGFSLIEVLFALVVLAVGLLAIAQLQVAAIRGIQFSKHMTAATQLAQRQMEFLKALPFDHTRPTDAPYVDGAVIRDDNPNLNHYLDDNSNSNRTVAAGDGLPSDWHYFSDPVDEFGRTRADGGIDTRYYLRWTIENGGASTAALDVTNIPIPAPGQLLITVEVIWWENPKDRPASVNLEQDWSFSAFRSMGAHHVVIESTTQYNM